MPPKHLAEGWFLELKKNVAPEFISKNLDTCDTYNDNDDYFFPPWRYTTHSGCVFYSPLSGFSLLAYEVT